MAGRATFDGWSRLVAWLKVLLPLLALGLLSMLFLISNRINPEDAIPYAQVDVEERLREPRMTAPTYASVTDDGAAFEVRAAETRPGVAGTSGEMAQTVTARLTTQDGAVTDLVADTAVMSPDQTELTLTGRVELAHSTGYVVESEQMVARLDVTSVRTTTDVVATGPAGQITADRMHYAPRTTGSADYLLVFNGSVKLVYQPAK